MKNLILIKADEILEAIKEMDYNSQCAVVEVVRQVIISQELDCFYPSSPELELARHLKAGKPAKNITNGCRLIS